MKVFWSFCYYLDSTAQLRKFLSNVSVRMVQASCEVSIKVFADVALKNEDDLKIEDDLKKEDDFKNEDLPSGRYIKIRV